MLEITIVIYIWIVRSISIILIIFLQIFLASLLAN